VRVYVRAVCAAVTADADAATGPRWSELPPERLEIELAKLGITNRDLVKDAEDVPELREMMRLLSPEARVKLALEYFGDQGHPQPEKRTPRWLGAVGDVAIYDDLTPNWGRLPRLADEKLRRDPCKTAAVSPETAVMRDLRKKKRRKPNERVPRPDPLSIRAIAERRDVTCYFVQSRWADMNRPK
jgi:hypothetical protein